jgi:hypothetical protein
MGKYCETGIPDKMVQDIEDFSLYVGRTPGCQVFQEKIHKNED